MAVNNIRSKLLALGLSSAVVLSGTYLIVPFEGKVNKVYVDPVGILTSCHGHTGPELKLGQKFTDEQCLDQLAEDLVEHDKKMLKLINVDMTDHQHAAFLSFTYNVGVNSFKNSTLRKKLNNGDYTGACNELTKWVYAGKEVLPGLVRRREAEKKVCLGTVSP